jgi:Mg2+/Co2+ transporter CorB
LANAERLAVTVAPVIAVVERVLSPLITLFDIVTRRLGALVGAGHAIERPYLD